MSDQTQHPVATPGTLHTTYCCHVGDTDAELILDTGFFRPECMTYAPHMHIEWEIQIPYSGGYLVEISETGEAYRLSCGLLLLLPPGCYHNTAVISEYEDETAHPAPEKFALRFTVSNKGSDEEAVYRKLNDILSEIKAPILLSCPEAAALLAVAKGISIVTEGVWDNRFQYCDELRKMGASVSVDGKIAVFQGVDKLMGAPVRATDLRAGAAMIIAALMADGVTEIEQIFHIERGYEDIVEKLRGAGAQIRRVSDEPTRGANLMSS